MAHALDAAGMTSQHTGRPRKHNPAVRLPTLQAVKTKRKPLIDDSSRNVFSTVPLEADSGGRPSYMPYDKLHFPRITRDAGGNGAAEAQALWMVGMLHHEDDHGPSGSDVKKVRQYEVRLTEQRITTSRTRKYHRNFFKLFKV